MPTAARLVAILVVAVASGALGADPPGAAVALDTVTLDATKLRVHFIDIGPGLAVLIETPNDRKHVFIDGGKWGLAGMQEYVEHFVPTTSRIDLAVVTHADSDHYKGTHPGGSERRCLSHPATKPDARRLHRIACGAGHSTRRRPLLGHSEIYGMDADGANDRRLTRSREFAVHPDW